MEPERNAPEETLEELCRQADAEQDLERLLELASKIQPLIEARRCRKKPKLGMTDRAPKSENDARS
jgi:hypothetical protein